MIGVSFSFVLNCSHPAETLSKNTEMNVQTPTGRDNFSVSHEYGETFSLMDVMMWCVIIRHIAGSALNI